jgi:hypothetical protein
MNAAAQTYETIGILQPLAGKKTGKVKKFDGYAEYIDDTPLGFEIKVDPGKLPNSADGFLLTVTVNNQELVFDDNDENIEASLNIFLRVLKQDGKSGGTFEERFLIKINQADKDEALKSASTYRNYFELPAGSYKIDVILRDAKSGFRGIQSGKFEIPD